jgi:hypothetical protein
VPADGGLGQGKQARPLRLAHHVPVLVLYRDALSTSGHVEGRRVLVVSTHTHTHFYVLVSPRDKHGRAYVISFFRMRNTLTTPAVATAVNGTNCSNAGQGDGQKPDQRTIRIINR